MYTPIREGNRGGRGLFSWEEVRTMSYKDRECYLGSTLALGFLDKGGRWRKKDWWTKKRELGQPDQEEIKQVQNEDLQSIKEALGISKSKSKKKDKLSESEFKNMLKRKEEGTALEEQGHKVTGLGFESRLPTKKESPKPTVKKHKRQKKKPFKKPKFD